MTLEFEAMSFFCEDIREEKSGQDSVVGFMPDNIAIPVLPAMIPKIALYTRMRIPRDFEIMPITVVIKIADEEIHVTTVDQNLLQKVKKESIENDLPFGQVISRAKFQGLRVDKPAVMLVVARTDRFQIITGAARIRLSSPSASEQPSSQSPPAAQAS